MSEGQQPATVVKGLNKSVAARLYAASKAREYGLSEEEFEVILASVGMKYCSDQSDADRLALIESLRHEELALARGCAKGNDRAWEVFLTRYRASLYSSAYVIARNDAAGRELADSLYAELYGLEERAGERRSKLLYYMGRGSLEGWLRTVLAQEWINRKRRTRREVSLEEQLDGGGQFEAPAPSAAPIAATPASRATAMVLAELSSEERFLLAAYYLDGRTLAQIALVMRVHESTISRKLDRLVLSLRKDLRKRLIASGMSSAQADETLAEVDVRDLEVSVRENLKQESPPPAF
jgi:RNA polymerase sigma-70 factor (ECF subfamily)